VEVEFRRLEAEPEDDLTEDDLTEDDLTEDTDEPGREHA
jgi:hypothetical protein